MPDTCAFTMCHTNDGALPAGKRYLTDQERREALQHLAPARRYLLRLLLHRGLVAALLALSETWLGSRLLYQLLLRPLSLNSLNVRSRLYLRLARPVCSVCGHCIAAHCSCC